MDEKKYDSLPDNPLTPEAQLDLLLEQFLREPDDALPFAEEVNSDATVTPEETSDEIDVLAEEPPIAADAEDTASLSPEEKLDMLLSSFLAEPLPEESAPATLSALNWSDMFSETDDEILPTELPELHLEEVTETSAEEEPTEEVWEEVEEETAEGNEDPDIPAVILPLWEEVTPVEEEAAPEDYAEEIPEEAEEEVSPEEPVEEVSEEIEEEPAEGNEDPDIPAVILPLWEEETPAEEEAVPEDSAEEIREEAEVEVSPEEPVEEASEEVEEETAEDNEDPDIPAVILPLWEEETPAEEEAAPEECAEEIPEEAEEEVSPEEPVEEASEEADENPEEDNDEPEAPIVILPEWEEETTAQETPPSEQTPTDTTHQPEVSSDNVYAVAPTYGYGANQIAEPLQNDVDWEDEEDEEEDTALPPPKKRRPKNNKTYGLFGIPHILVTLIWLGIIVFIGVGLGQFIWNCAADVLALGRPDTEVAIKIDESDSLEDIADKLGKTGLIRYPSLFVIYGQISDARDSIRAGSYTLNTLYDYHALVDAMSSNQLRITTNVTIPEGYTCKQIFNLLESKGVSTVAKLEAAAANSELGDYWFLEDVEQGTANCLEGFLFPDTYTFYLDHDPVGVLQKFLDNFNKRFNESMKIKLDTLNTELAERMRANGLSEAYIAEHLMTVRDVVIVASMIEKETASAPESYNISSVIYNRLTNPNTFPYLQIDATIVYYTGRVIITAEDLATDHPYNSYTRPGLIPGAISNPGGYSLDAALDPTATEYYYYALDPSTGEHHFSKTLKEHNDFLESIRKEEQEEPQA